jgi:phage baseplate assembly protein gpV
MDRLEDIIGDMVYRQREEERKRSNNRLEGTCKQVHPDGRRVKVDVGIPGEELLTPWIRTREQNGNFKTHFMPAVGEKVTVVSNDGEISEASVVEPGTYSDQNESPVSDANEGTIRKGQAHMTWRDDRVQGRFGNARFGVANGVAKISVGGAFVAVSNGQIITSSVPVVGADPNPQL